MFDFVCATGKVGMLSYNKKPQTQRLRFSCSIGVTGFEPTTPSSLTKCASQLRYTPIFNMKFLLFNRQMLLYMVRGRIASPFLKFRQKQLMLPVISLFNDRRNIIAILIIAILSEAILPFPFYRHSIQNSSSKVLSSTLQILMHRLIVGL